MGGLDQRREHVADHRRAHDLAVGDQRADVQPVVGDGDVLELVQPRNVDHDAGRVAGKFQVGQQVGAAGQDFRRGAMLGKQRHGVREVLGQFKSERLHPGCFLAGADRISGYIRLFYIKVTRLSV